METIQPATKELDSKVNRDDNPINEKEIESIVEYDDINKAINEDNQPGGNICASQNINDIVNGGSIISNNDISDKRNDNTRQSIISTACNVCGYQAVKKHSVLTCHKCNCFIHFHCTLLPPYMLYTLSTSAKKYVCEQCADTPVSFLQNLMKVDISGKIEQPEVAQPNDKTGQGNNHLEDSINKMCVLFEKYDLNEIAEKLITVESKLERTNNTLKENVGNLKSCNHECTLTSKEDSAHKEGVLMEENDTIKKEMTSYKKSYELMVDTVSERDKQVKSLNENNEKLSRIITERNCRIRDLEAENDSLKHQEEEIIIAQNNVEKANSDIGDLQQVIVKLTDRVESGQAIIKLLKDQLTESSEREKSLISTCRSEKEKSVISVVEKDETVKVKEDRPKVTILHDSLFKNINESMMSRENVEVKKVWSPDFENMTKELDTMTEQVDTIVIQALTRDLKNMSIPDIEANLQVITEKATKKSKSVVISTIVGRSDNEKMRRKAEVVNSYIKYSFIDNPKVKICDNSNLRDDKFRLKDGIHLVPHGTSRLANNTKFAVAKALNITVQRKTNDSHSTRYNRYDHSHNRWYDDDRWYEYDEYEYE